MRALRNLTQDWLHQCDQLYEAAAAVFSACKSGCRYCKHDGQLVKKAEQLIDGAASYFKWASTHTAPCTEVAPLALRALLTFIDAAACFFAPVGVPAKLIAPVLRTLKGFAPAERERAAAAVAWRAQSLAGSAALWRDMRPALRVALESANAAGGSGAGASDGVEGRRKRARR